MVRKLGLLKFDHINRLTILFMIPLSNAHCKFFMITGICQMESIPLQEIPQSVIEDRLE
jgi:hypothetical protein